MANSLKKFIEKQLKENIPLSRIKKDLQDKGYGIDEINKAVREAISGVDKKIPTSTIFQIGILVVGIIIVGIVVYFVGVKPAGERTTETSTGTTTAIEACKDFTETISGISCEDAVKVALLKYPGKAVLVEDNFVKTFDNPSGSPPKKDWLGWLVRIDLDKELKSGNITYYEVDVVVDNEGYALTQLIGR